MGKSAILAIRIIGDATDAVTALEKVDGSAKSMEATMNKASAASAVALAAIGAAAWQAGQSASELQQAAGAVESVYGEHAAGVHALAESAAQSVGLSASAYSNMAAVIGAQLKNMGLPMEAVAGQSADLITLGGDLAATFGGTTADAVAALSSLLRGERDPIERYGVSIKAADVEAQKATMGLSGLTGEADAAATTQATLALLLSQTADASGQFARESGTAAGTAQIAAAEWENASAALGEQLLPIMAEGATMLADLAGWMGENSELVTVLAGVIGVLASGIILANGAMKAYAAVQAIQTAAQIANNAAWLASPVTWIILAVVAAIALIVAGVVLVIQNWDKIAAKAAEVWGAVVKWCQEVATWIGDNITAAVREVGNFFADFGKNVENIFKGIVGWIEDVVAWFGKLGADLMPDWLEEALGMKSIAMTVDAPTDAPTARMLFSAADTVAGFAQPMSMTAASPKEAWVPRSPVTPREDRRPNIRIEFNGLVTDPHATAQEIRKILDDDDVLTGRRRPEVPTW